MYASRRKGHALPRPTNTVPENDPRAGNERRERNPLHARRAAFAAHLFTLPELFILTNESGRIFPSSRGRTHARRRTRGEVITEFELAQSESVELLFKFKPIDVANFYD